jgi:hypothetical protein
MNTSSLRQLLVRTGVALVTAATLVLLTSGCDKSPHEETRVFEEAEALYRAGDYDGATLRYEAFLDTYPRSPFAKTARMRMATVEREVESVMGTGGANRPVLIPPTTADSEAIIERALGDAGPKPDAAGAPAGPDAGVGPPSSPRGSGG